MFAGCDDELAVMDPYEFDEINAFHVNAQTERKNEALFSDEIGFTGEDYDNSKFNIKSALDRLLSAARAAKTNPMKDIKKYKEELMDTNAMLQ